MSVPGATTRAMPGGLEPLPASGAGPAVLAAELTGRIRAELPVIGELGEREQVLVAAWLTGLRSARTHRAYAGDVTAWPGRRWIRTTRPRWAWTRPWSLLPMPTPAPRRCALRSWSGPLLATAAGGRLRQGHLWELVRRLARTAGVGAWEQLSPHSLRHSAITFALDAGASPARRAGLRRPQRSPDDPPVRPLPRQPGPQRRLYRRCLPGVTALRACSPSDHRARLGGGSRTALPQALSAQQCGSSHAE